MLFLLLAFKQVDDDDCVVIHNPNQKKKKPMKKAKLQIEKQKKQKEVEPPDPMVKNDRFCFFVLIGFDFWLSRTRCLTTWMWR